MKVICERASTCNNKACIHQEPHFEYIYINKYKCTDELACYNFNAEGKRVTNAACIPCLSEFNDKIDKILDI